jgi:hypothetical protein
MRRSLALAGLLTAALAATFVPAGAEEKGGDWGTVKGQVVLAKDAAIPQPVQLNVNKDQNHCLEKGPIFSEELVVNKDNRGVQWALVWLAAPQGQKLPVNPAVQAKLPKEVVMDQPCCKFEPHVVVLQQGQVFVAKNSAPVSHNTHWQGHPLYNAGGNVIVPAKSEHKVDNLKAQKLPIKVSCDIHPWMGAWIGVFEHPYAAVTDADGRFEIKDAPAGTWQLIVWQEKVGWVLPGLANGMPVTIKAGGVTDVGPLDLKPR